MKTLIYEMNVPTWPSADAMIKHLDRVKALGAKHVCLSGLCSETDCNEVAVPFSNNSFEAFVAKANKLKLGVIMSIDLDSTAIANVWREKYKEIYSYKSGNRAYLKWRSQTDKSELNHATVRMFRDLVEAWSARGIYGFKVHVPHPNGVQTSAEEAERILISIFSAINARLIIEVDTFDDGDRYSYLADWILDSNLNTAENFVTEAQKHSQSWLFMLCTETSESRTRFPVAHDCTPESTRWVLFHTGARTLWLYQGQELGLTDDPKNAFPIQNYEFQERHANSYLNAFLKECAEWQHS